MMNNKGYTILESVIAMLLVAIIVGGIFSSLMAARRAIMEPSYREEMMYAVESANNLLKNFVDNDTSGLDDIKGELCQTGALDLLSEGEHSINCRLPYVCDPRQGSKFSYIVTEKDLSVTTSSDGVSLPPVTVRHVVFDITCNREKL